MQALAGSDIESLKPIAAAAKKLAASSKTLGAHALATPAKLTELYAHHQALEDHFGQLKAADKALLYCELGSQTIETTFTAAAMAQPFVGMVESMAAASDSHAHATLNHAHGVVAGLAPVLEIAGIASAALLTTQEIRAIRAKQLSIQQYQTMLATLEREVATHYKDYIPYLGKRSLAADAIKRNVKTLQNAVNREQNLANIITHLAQKDLTELIAEQAYAMYYGGKKPIAHTHIYQLAIDDKINSLTLAPQHDRKSLQQFVIAQQHLKNVAVATPLCKQFSNTRALTVILSIAILGCAIALAFASFGVLTPVVATALATTAAATGTVMALTKKAIHAREGKIEAKLQTSEQAFNVLYTASVGAMPRLDNKFIGSDAYDAIATRIIMLIQNAQDRLTLPLREVVQHDSFSGKSGFEQLVLLHEKIDALKTISQPWRFFALKQHKLYQLIAQLDLTNAAKANTAISTYIIKQRKMQRLRDETEKTITPAPHQLTASPRLKGDVQTDTLTPEQSQAVAKAFSM